MYFINHKRVCTKWLSSARRQIRMKIICEKISCLSVVSGKRVNFKTHLEVKVLRKGHAEDQSYH